MSAQVFIGGAWRSITGGKIYVGGAWRTITRGKVYKGGVWKDGPAFVAAFSAEASPGAVSGALAYPYSVGVPSDPATITPTGGLAPYAYSWDGDGSAPTSPTSATSAFVATVVPGGTFEGTAVCTVTDSLGSTATASVTVFLSNEG